MSDPLNYITNSPGTLNLTWKECPWFFLQFYNSFDGSYNVGDGPEYPLFSKVTQSTPYYWHTSYQPVESNGEGSFTARYTGPLTVNFKTRLKDDTTGVEFRLLVDDVVIHTYRTSLVNNGGCVDVLMNHSFMVVPENKIRMTVQDYINTGTATMQDFDDYNNPNTIISFSM